MRWHFGPFSFAVPAGPLYRGDEPVKLMPKSLAVLAALVAHADRVVSKQALIAAAWPGTLVGDDAVTYQIQVLRQALGDDTRDPKYIATVHRIGFRFVAQVERR